jgi:hypothetical protein
MFGNRSASGHELDVSALEAVALDGHAGLPPCLPADDDICKLFMRLLHLLKQKPDAAVKRGRRDAESSDDDDDDGDDDEDAFLSISAISGGGSASAEITAAATAAATGGGCGSSGGTDGFISGLAEAAGADGVELSLLWVLAPVQEAAHFNQQPRL